VRERREREEKREKKCVSLFRVRQESGDALTEKAGVLTGDSTRPYFEFCW